MTDCSEPRLYQQTIQIASLFRRSDDRSVSTGGSPPHDAATCSGLRGRMEIRDDPLRQILLRFHADCCGLRSAAISSTEQIRQQFVIAAHQSSLICITLRNISSGGSVMPM